MKELELSRAFTLMESGPVVFISTAHKGKNNLMTITWHMVMDFTPRFALTTGAWNYSYEALVKTKECVIAIPGVDIARKAIGVGTVSGADTDKFKKFGFTPLPASEVAAPLIKECVANIECRVVDHIKKHDIFVLDAVAAWTNGERKERRVIHAIGDGTFIVDGKKLNCRKLMKDKLPFGV